MLSSPQRSPTVLSADFDPAVTMRRNCVYIPAAISQAHSQYTIVVSDADDLNAVLNISTVQLVYLDFTNASIASNLVS